MLLFNTMNSDITKVFLCQTQLRYNEVQLLSVYIFLKVGRWIAKNKYAGLYL